MSSSQPPEGTSRAIERSGPPRQGPAGLSWKKRLSFTAIGLVAVYGVIELFSWAVLEFALGGSAEIQHVETNDSPTPAEIGDRIEFLHPYFGFMHQPHSEPYRNRPELSVTEYGFFDDSPPLLDRREGRLIVAVTGGSLAEEFGLVGTEELRRRLNASNRFADQEIEFVRLAIAGFKQPQQLMMLNYLLSLGAEFDVLVNIDGFNEIALPAVENVPNDVAVSFPRSWHSRILESYDTRVMRLIGRRAYLKELRRSLARIVFESWLLHYSPTVKLLWKISDNVIVGHLSRDYVKLNELIPERLTGGVTGPEQNFADEAALLEHAVEIWQRSSRLMNVLCADHEIEYLHFLQPNQYVPNSKTMSREEAAVAYDPRQPYRPPVEQGYPLLIERGRELTRRGVRFYDLTQMFADDPGPHYRDDCCHLNERGNELLAAKIAEAILQGSRTATDAATDFP